MSRMLLASLIIGLISAAPLVAEESDHFSALEQEVLKQSAQKAKLTARQAVEIAAKQAGDARLHAIEIGTTGENVVFEIGFLTAASHKVFAVDAVTGAVVESADEKPEAREAQTLAGIYQALAESKVTLAEAMATGLAQVYRGAVVRAEANVANKTLSFDVALLTGDTIRVAKIAANGELLSVTESKPEGQAWTFDRDEPGKPLAGWKFTFTNAATGKAVWSVAKDDKPMTGPNVLTLKSESGGNTFNVALAEKTSYKDVDVRTRLRPNTGKEDQGGGLVWRTKDENNYYICRFNPLEDNFRVYKVVAGKRLQLGTATAKAEAGKWHVVRAKMIGNHVLCYLNEKKLLDVTDDEFKDAGMVGLWTKADASSSFDNFAVQPGKLTPRDTAVAKPADAKSDPAKKSGGEEEEDDDDK